MKTLYMMLGIPGSNIPETVETLKEFLSSDPKNNVTVWSKKFNTPRKYIDCKASFMIEMRHEIYKWVQEAGENDYGIVNIPFLTAFDRYDFVEEIDKAAKLAMNDLIIIAIYHERSYKYLYETYLEGADSLPREKQIMLSRYVRRMQQPVREEGFDLIYRIGGRDSINLTQLTKMMSKISNDPFWTVAEPTTDSNEQERDSDEEN